MNKFLTVTCFVVLASPAFAQGMAAPAKDSAAAPMANDTMKMDHKKPMKKPAMKHDAMGSSGMAAPSGGMASGSSGSMGGPNH